jgi:hypothetical protein
MTNDREETVKAPRKPTSLLLVLPQRSTQRPVIGRLCARKAAAWVNGGIAYRSAALINCSLTRIHSQFVICHLSFAFDAP